MVRLQYILYDSSDICLLSRFNSSAQACLLCSAGVQPAALPRYDVIHVSLAKQKVELTTTGLIAKKCLRVQCLIFKSTSEKK